MDKIGTTINMTISSGFSFISDQTTNIARCYGSKLVVINLAVTRSGTLTASTWYTFCTIPSSYAPAKDIYFRGVVSGMQMSFSGKVTSTGTIQGYHTNDYYARLGTNNYVSVAYTIS